MMVKDVLESAAHVAEVAIALVAVAPALHKGIYLLRTEPIETEEQRRASIAMLFDDRMGIVQRLWTNFLDWCRTTNDDHLTWKESRSRYIWCPREGHRFVDQCRPARLFQARCKNCQALFTVETQEDLDRCEAGGRPPWATRKTRTREADLTEDERTSLEIERFYRLGSRRPLVNEPGLDPEREAERRDPAVLTAR